MRSERARRLWQSLRHVLPRSGTTFDRSNISKANEIFGKPNGGANRDRCWATLGHIQPLLVQVNGTSGHVWHRQAMVGECLLSSRSRVRIALGAQLKLVFSLLCPYAGSQPGSQPGGLPSPVGDQVAAMRPVGRSSCPPLPDGGARGRCVAGGLPRDRGAQQQAEHRLRDLLQGRAGAAGGPVLGHCEVGEPGERQGENLPREVVAQFAAARPFPPAPRLPRPQRGRVLPWRGSSCRSSPWHSPRRARSRRRLRARTPPGRTPAPRL